MSRGIWLDWEPGDHGSLYWWEANAIEYAPAGYQWQPDASGWCPYEVALAAQGITDISHARRWYGAVAALAKDCKAARYMLMQACWPEIRRSYSMDPRVPFTSLAHNDDDLYMPLRQLLTLLPSTGHGNRREAHAIEVCAAAAPYMADDERGLYVGAWGTFLDGQVDRFGRADFSFTGDAASSSGLQPPVEMAFQQQLLCAGGLSLAGVGSTKAARAAARIATFLGPDPPYYIHTGGSFATAHASPNKGTALKDYTYWTHPETVNFAAIVEASKDRGLGEHPLDCVPPEARGW
jgi:hypothetical protein